MEKKSNSVVVALTLVLVVICCCFCLAGGIAVAILADDEGDQDEKVVLEDTDYSGSEVEEPVPAEERRIPDEMDMRIAPGEVVTFEGVFEEYDGGCAADAQCRAKISGEWIVTNPGFVPAGSVKVGNFALDPDKDLGKKVKVKAESTTEGMTIVGSTDYYIILAE